MIYFTESDIGEKFVAFVRDKRDQDLGRVYYNEQTNSIRFEPCEYSIFDSEDLILIAKKMKEVEK